MLLSKTTLLFPVCIIRTVYSMIVMILPLYLHETGFSTVQVGVIISIYGYAALLMDLCSSIFIDNIRKTFLIKIGIFLISACSLLYYVHTKSIMYQFFLQILLGFSLGLFRPASMALISEVTIQRKTGTALSHYNIASIIGSCLGPIIATTIASAAAFTSVFMGAFIFSFIALSYSIYTLNTKYIVSGPKNLYIMQHFRKMFSLIIHNRMYIPIIFILVDIFILRLWTTYLPLYVKAHSDLSIRQIGIIFSIESFVYILVQPFWGKKVDIIGYKIPLIIGIISPSIIAFTPCINGFIGLSILYAVMGMLNSAAYPAYMNFAISCSGKEDKGKTMTLMTSASDFAYILGPMTGGIIFGIWGDFSPIFLFAIIPSLVGVLVFLFSLTQADVSRDDLENIPVS